MAMSKMTTVVDVSVAQECARNIAACARENLFAFLATGEDDWKVRATADQKHAARAYKHARLRFEEFEAARAK